jgi:hypothetical protein
MMTSHSEQSMVALEYANEVRLRRREVKRQIAAGTLSIAVALVEPACEKMSVYDLLCAQYQWGRDRTVRTLSGLMIGEQRHVGELTDRQRGLIVRACKERAIGNGR